MIVKVYPDKAIMGRQAAAQAAASIRQAINSKGHARIIAATGASQFEFLDALTCLPDIDWQRVEMFH